MYKLSLLFFLYALTDAQSLGSYAVDSKTFLEATTLLQSPKPTFIQPNPHPDAQWFTSAKLGWMLHWGIHSISPTEPSWAMMFDVPWGNNDNSVHQETYYGWASQFHPQNYDPEKWIVGIKKAGFTYVVITTKHHDGYALWPTQYGDMNTRVYMESRDLIAEYVEACRKYGVKVGFYFSLPDWHYPGYRSSLAAIGVDGDWHWGLSQPSITAEQDSARFKEFYAYTYRQLKELMTNYGKIDLLWFDGAMWPTLTQWGCTQTKSWIRSLQPGIVMNDRYCEGGDFITYEIHKPTNPPSSWWEYVNTWGGAAGWGTSYWFGSGEEVVNTMNSINTQGGNYLANASPTKEGDMVASFYDRCNNIADLRFPDKTPPLVAPSGITATATRNSIDLQWKSLSAVEIPPSGLSGYRIFRNGKLYRTTMDTTFIDSGLTENTSYTYEIAALNMRDSAGPKSTPLIVKTTGGSVKFHQNAISQRNSTGVSLQWLGRNPSIIISAQHSYRVKFFTSSRVMIKEWHGDAVSGYGISTSGLPLGIYLVKVLIDESKPTSFYVRVN